MKTKAISIYARALCLGALALYVAQGQSNASVINLGSAGPGNWAAISLSENVNISYILGGVGGNIGLVGPNTTLSLSGGSDIQGNVYLASGGQVQTSGGSTTGTIFGGLSGIGGNSSQDSFLQLAKNDALAAAASYGAMAATMTVAGNQLTGNGDTVINGSAGVNVLNLSAINLSGGSVTLNAPAGACFVINVSGTFHLSGGADLFLSGGITPDSVIYNVSGSGDVQTSGGLATEANIFGILLAPNRDVSLSPGLVTGEIIADKITLASGGFIEGITPVPEPATIFSAGLLVLAVGGGQLRRWVKREKTAPRIS